MLQPPPQLPQPQSENKCPDCVSLALEAIPVRAESIDVEPIDGEQFEFPITIQFDEQWESILAGRVKVGLKGGKLKLKLVNAEMPRESRNLTGRKTLSCQSQFQANCCDVTATDSESDPSWEFQLKMGSQVLKGSLPTEILGMVRVAGKPCDVEARFEVELGNVHLTEIEGLLPPGISRNKQCVIERLLAKKLLELKLQPYLSRVEWRYA